MTQCATVYVHNLICTYTKSYTHPPTCTHTHILEDRHTYIHAYIIIHIHTYIHTYMHAYIHTWNRKAYQSLGQGLEVAFHLKRCVLPKKLLGTFCHQPC